MAKGAARVPVVTLVVFTLTTAFSVAGLVRPGLEQALSRDPALIGDGQWYRLVTSLVVQDGGVAGTLSNLGFLVVLGILVERRVGAWRWLLLYLGGAVVGQTAGILFTTIGAGNSIAICGLAGGASVGAAWARELRPAALVGVLFAGAIGADAVPGSASAVAFAAVFIVFGLLTMLRDRAPGWLGAAVLVAVGLALAAAQNLHGPALLAGAALGPLVRPAHAAAS